MNSDDETLEEREKRISERANEARKRVSMTPGQAETIKKAQRKRWPDDFRGFGIRIR